MGPAVLIPAPIAEQPAPVWLPVLILLIPVTIMLVAFRSAIRWHLRVRASKRALAGRWTAEQIQLGSAAAIEDPSSYAPDALLKALAVKPEDDGPTPDGLPFDDGWYATMLGLKSKTDGETNLEPHVHWGPRPAARYSSASGPTSGLNAAIRGPTATSARSRSCASAHRGS